MSACVCVSEMWNVWSAFVRLAGPQQQLNNFNISSKTFKDCAPSARFWLGVKCSSAMLALQLFSLNVEQSMGGCGEPRRMPSNAHVTIYFACSPKETNDKPASAAQLPVVQAVRY